MTKQKNHRPNIFHLLYLPILFVQYLVSFVLAAVLSLVIKKEPSQRRDIFIGETNESEVDPLVMKVIEEVGRENSANQMEMG